MKFDVKLQCGETIEIYFNDDFKKSTAFKRGPRGKIIVPVIEKLVIKGQEISYKDNVNAHLNYDFFNDDEIGFYVSFNNPYTIEEIVNLLEIELSDKHRLNMKLPNSIKAATELMVNKRRIANEEKIQNCLVDVVEHKPNILMKYHTTYKYNFFFKDMEEESVILEDHFIKEKLDILNSKYNNDNRESIKKYAYDIYFGDYSVVESYDMPYNIFVDFLNHIENLIKTRKHEEETTKIKIERERSEKFEKALKEAKETNTPVKFNAYMAPCNNPSEECDLDYVSVYVNPDGEIEEVRNHTW